MDRPFHPIRTVLALGAVLVAYAGMHPLMLLGSCSTPAGPGETLCPAGVDEWFFMAFLGTAATIVLLTLGAHAAVLVALFLAIGVGAVDAGARTSSAGMVFFGVMFLLLPVLGVLSVVLAGLRRLRAARLLRDGIHALGRVVDVEDTGVRINDRPRLALTLRIEAEGVLPPYESTRKVTVSPTASPRVGDTYEVWLDPHNHDDWMFAPHGVTRDALAANDGSTLTQLFALGRMGRQPKLPPPLSAAVIEQLGRLNADRLAGRITASEFTRRYDALVTA